MLFGFVCFCRGPPNNPVLFRALGAYSAEGVKVDSMDYIFIKTPNSSASSVESILTTLYSFGIRPVRLTKDAPEILATETCTRHQRQVFFKHIKLNRLRYHRGVNTTYWYWVQPPLDTLGQPLPPPAGAYETDTTPSSKWKDYWDRCPNGEHSTMAILD
jgi:hypothetical protein